MIAAIVCVVVAAPLVAGTVNLFAVDEENTVGPMSPRIAEVGDPVTAQGFPLNTSINPPLPGTKENPCPGRHLRAAMCEGSNPGLRPAGKASGLRHNPDGRLTDRAGSPIMDQ